MELDLTLDGRERRWVSLVLAEPSIFSAQSRVWSGSALLEELVHQEGQASALASIYQPLYSGPYHLDQLILAELTGRVCNAAFVTLFISALSEAGFGTGINKSFTVLHQHNVLQLSKNFATNNFFGQFGEIFTIRLWAVPYRIKHLK